MMNALSDKIYVKRQRLLYIIVAVLVFEGVARKLFPPLGVLIFFLKDILCMLAVYWLAEQRIKSNSNPLLARWGALAILFVPLLFNTLFYDPMLVFFGGKQYLLFAVVAIMVPLAFPPSKFEDFKRFVAFVAVLVVPTTIVAGIQNSLPPSHWLNKSVAGESLEHFSAAGKLRVSSTFSFTGQYSYFLNLVTAFIALRFFLPPVSNRKTLRRFVGILPIVFALMLLVGAFVTGGRTAVLGCGAVIALGFALATLRAPKTFLGKGLLVFAVIVAGLMITRSVKPEFFAAYEQRSQGFRGMSQNEEVQERVLESFMGWNDWLWDQSWRSIFMGNGLGVMSNGSDQISFYAAGIRAGGFWTESDFASSIWEGGLYMVVVWYGFRLMFIVMCFKVWNSMRSPVLVSCCSFLLGYVIIIGLIGTIGIQPPLAIWWWLAVGSVFALKGFDEQKNILKI